VMGLLRDLHREGRTILLVTHDDAVASYAAREILLQDGKLVSDRTHADQSLQLAIEGAQ
jgi:macrolide transport system ATP-binding/permease protein